MVCPPANKAPINTTATAHLQRGPGMWLAAHSGRRLEINTYTHTSCAVGGWLVLPSMGASEASSSFSGSRDTCALGATSLRGALLTEASTPVRSGEVPDLDWSDKCDLTRTSGFLLSRSLYSVLQVAPPWELPIPRFAWESTAKRNSTEDGQR
eukprot:827015-Pelagomonas_calceolata.AAC.1